MIAAGIAVLTGLVQVWESESLPQRQQKLLQDSRRQPATSIRHCC